MKKKINEVTVDVENPADIKTLKSTNALGKDDTVRVVKKAQEPSTMSMTEDAIEPEAIIKPQDKATIKYLSNVKDNKTGEISKPFTIGGKKYQMVRGITPEKEIVMAVYSHDDVDDSGENIIHPIDFFEENIAKKAIKESGYDYAERDYHNKQEVKDLEPKKEIDKPEQHDSLKLSEFKHFLVDKNTGKIRKFKRVEELAKAKMSENEKYMNLGQFKKHVDEALFGLKSKGKVMEVEEPPLKPDVQKAIDQMVLKIKPYMDKINEPVEKVQLIVKLTTMLQLEPAKYPLIMAGLKKASNSTFGAKPSTTEPEQQTVTENKVITKNQLIENLKPKTVKRTIKLKDIK